MISSNDLNIACLSAMKGFLGIIGASHSKLGLARLVPRMVTRKSQILTSSRASRNKGGKDEKFQTESARLETLLALQT